VLAGRCVAYARVRQARLYSCKHTHSRCRGSAYTWASDTPKDAVTRARPQNGLHLVKARDSKSDQRIELRHIPNVEVKRISFHSRCKYTRQAMATGKKRREEEEGGKRENGEERRNLRLGGGGRRERGGVRCIRGVSTVCRSDSPRAPLLAPPSNF
jgi:hypothetical protein